MIKIYVITHIATNRQYIGQTSKELSIRFQQHYNCKNCTKLHNALRKYGKDAFKIELIGSTASVQEADELERFEIQNKGTLSPKGFNLTSGGWSNKIVSEETRSKQSLAAKKRPPAFAGKKHTKEAKEKNRIAHLGKVTTHRPVVDNLGNEFFSITEAAKYHTLSRNSVGNIVRNRAKRTKNGLTFKYKGR